MHAYHVRGKEKTFSSFFFQRRPLTLDFPIRRRSSIEEFPIPGWGESWIYRIRDVKASLFSPPLPSSINSMHLFGDAELDQGLRPQAQVALAVWKSLGKTLLNYSIFHRWKGVAIYFALFLLFLLALPIHDRFLALLQPLLPLVLPSPVARLSRKRWT